MTAPAAETAEHDDPDDETTTERTDAPDAAEAEDGPLLKDDGTPVTAADWAAVQTALMKARRDARRAGKPKADEDAPDVDKVAADATAAAESKFKPLVVKAHARSAFVEAGLALPKDNPEGALARVLKLLDLDDIDVTEDGTVDGLREQVEDIRRDFPELFATTRQRPARVDAADRGAPAPKQKSSAEILAAALSGGR